MKEKIAILGGGVGALTTAFELTSVSGWQERYDITVYQMGWRLGGKGASGRDQKIAHRIYEHGLHIWMGFYENGFRLMRRAYSECAANGLMPGSPLESVETAFSAQDFTPVMEQVGSEWQVWSVHFPPNSEKPGMDDLPLVTVYDYVASLLNLIVHTYDQEMGKKDGFIGSVLCGASHVLDLVDRNPHRWEWLRKVVNDFSAAFVHKNTVLHRAAALANSGGPDTLLEVVKLLQDFHIAFRFAAGPFMKHDATLRRLDLMFDTGFAVIRGVLQDDLLDGDFSKIDEMDFIAWLTRNGASQAASPIAIAMYDACFGYKDGVDRNMAAGATLYGVLRLICTYKGSIMWRMEAGMGDTIFSPIYLALKARGVNFEFFHKVTNLGCSPNNIETIEIDVQATPKTSYDPLIQVKGVYCWPSEPLYNQLVEGAALQDPTLVNPCLESWWTDCKPVATKVLKRGQDFDRVVCGIAIGAFPYICQELIAAKPEWQAMVANVATVKTQAAQLWLNKTPDQIGWNLQSPVLTSYVEPYDTWADMTHLLKREDWPTGADVQQLAYFCNSMTDAEAAPPFTDHQYPTRELARVTQTTEQFLTKDVASLWPSFQKDDLVGGGLDAQFVRANIDPTELYTLTLAGTNKHRLQSGQSGFRNMVLAGDWTDTPLNIGCVEAAVMSGMMASQALCGSPAIIHGAFGVPGSNVASA